MISSLRICWDRREWNELGDVTLKEWCFLRILRDIQLEWALSFKSGYYKDRPPDFKCCAIMNKYHLAEWLRQRNYSEELVEEIVTFYLTSTTYTKWF